MEFSTHQVGDVTIVDVSGRLIRGESGATLRDTVHDLLSKGLKRILLNLGDVNYIDSSGIAELVSAFTAAKKQGGELKTGEPDQESPRPAADREALHRLRCEGRRSSGRKVFQQVGQAAEHFVRFAGLSGMFHQPIHAMRGELTRITEPPYYALWGWR